MAAGVLSPVATFVLIVLTLLGALPMYSRIATMSPHGQGSILILDQSISPDLIFRGSEQSVIPSYQWWISLRPRYYVIPTLSFRLTAGLVVEWFNAAADDTTRPAGDNQRMRAFCRSAFSPATTLFAASSRLLPISDVRSMKANPSPFANSRTSLPPVSESRIGVALFDFVSLINARVASVRC
jgi:hypothetical protein